MTERKFHTVNNKDRDMTGKKIFLLCIIILIFSSLFCFAQEKTTLLEQEVQKHFTQAQAFIDARNYKYALEEYRKVFPLDSDCLEAHQSYVDCMYEYTDKNLKEAFTFYNKQIKKDKDMVPPWYIRLFGGGVKNTTPAWYFGLGYCYFKTGNKEQAKDAWQTAIDLLKAQKKYDSFETYFNCAKDRGIELDRYKLPLYVYNLSFGSIIFFVIAFFAIRYYLRKKVLEKIIKLEGTFEVFSPRGFKVYMLDCTDKKLFQKYGDTIRIGSKKGCDIHLKIKDEQKVYAILEAEKIEEQNRITVRTTSDDIEMFLEVPKSRYTPDDMVKLPFKGSPLWDNDIINIKDYRIFYHNVKLGKRLWKDYPESAKGFLFVDPDTPQEVELPDMALLQSGLVPEDEQVYNPYQDISKTVKTIISNGDNDEEEESEYDFEPMDEKYILEILPPSEKEHNSDLLTYKTDDEEEEYYYEENITLPEKNITDDILAYPVENPVNEEVYEFEETLIPEIEKNKELLIYPDDEEEEYEIDVLAPVETGKKHSADVLKYSTEEDLKDEEYEFEEIMPEDTDKNDELLPYPVPTQEEDEMLAYAEKVEEKFEEHEDDDHKEEEAMELLEHYPTHLQKINTKLNLVPYEEQQNSVSMDLTGIELSSQGEVFCGIQGMEIEKQIEDIEDISLEFSTPIQVKNSMENTGVSLDFSIFKEYKDEDNIQVSSLIIDDLPEEENKITISGKKSSEENKVKKKIKKKIKDGEDIEIPEDSNSEKSCEEKKVKKKITGKEEQHEEKKVKKKIIGKEEQYEEKKVKKKIKKKDEPT